MTAARGDQLLVTDVGLLPGGDGRDRALDPMQNLSPHRPRADGGRFCIVYVRLMPRSSARASIGRFDM